MPGEQPNDERASRSNDVMKAPAMGDELPYISHPSAVVFTHMGSLSRVDDPEDIESSDYKDFFKSYIECNREHKVVSIVYAYVDWAVRDWVRHNACEVFAIDPTKAAEERVFVDILKRAEEEAIEESNVPRDRHPEFIFVGIMELLHLLIYMNQVDPSLIALLGGEERFTYDSPKFVEAVIRIARGKIPHLSIHPVIRIDEDVKPNAASLEQLIDTYLQQSQKDTFFFFSGGYGMRDGEEDIADHYLNDYAVRTHWFFPPGTKSEDPVPPNTKEQIRRFLADFAELGATQFLDSEYSYSDNLQQLLEDERPKAKKREAPQVISGAGLVMSTTAIRFLPPFMNMNHQITWIDDHIKRRLHEAIGDIKVNAVERVHDAKIKQDRHGKGVTLENIEEADRYFPNLVRGCIFIRLISNVDGTKTRYSELIQEIVKLGIDIDSEGPSKTALLIKEIMKPDIDMDSEELSTVLGELRDELMQQAKTRCEEVLESWKSLEFSGKRSYDWATRFTQEDINKFCKEMVKDAINYLKLVDKWPIFVRAIDRLPFKGNRWLYWKA